MTILLYVNKKAGSELYKKGKHVAYSGLKMAGMLSVALIAGKIYLDHSMEDSYRTIEQGAFGSIRPTEEQRRQVFNAAVKSECASTEKMLRKSCREIATGVSGNIWARAGGQKLYVK